MHWRNITDPKFRELALNNVLTYFPYLDIDEAEKDIYDELNLSFGSTGVSIRLGVFDSEAEAAFMHSACIALAIAIDQQLPGEHEFLVLTHPASTQEVWSGHVALMLDENTALDFHGNCTISDIVTEYSRFSWEVRDYQWLVNNIVDSEFRDDPLSYLGELEHFTTEHFAHEILLRDGIISCN